MTLEIYDSVNNAYVDITPYVAFGGIKWARNDVEGEEAGRTINGTMIRSRKAQKIRLDITCRPLTSTEAATLLALINPEKVMVKYSDPLKGARTGVYFYSNNVPATHLMRKSGVDYWTGISFPLIEI